MPSTIRRNRQSGFTLIEVMVALTVVAVTLPALLFLLSQQIDGTAYLRDRSVAQWVAADRVAEVRLAVAKQKNARTGVIAGELNVRAAPGIGEVKFRKHRYPVLCV